MRDSSHEAEVTSVDDPKAVLLSISDILKESRSSSSSPWHLALVQRERVWTPFEAAMLLDSLLEGYPIGSFLLCRAKNTKVHELADRSVRDAEESSWQIIDGQQRLWAILTLFGNGAVDAESDSEFFLKIGSERPRLDPSKKRDEGLRRWISWTEEDLDPFAEHGSGKDTRAEWVSIRKVGKAFFEDSPFPVNQVLASEPAVLDEWLQKVDDEYKGPLPSMNEKVFERVQALAKAWCKESIPVQRVTLHGPEDVYEAFTRINMQGITTNATDVFFAAAKTRWSDAEKCLDRIRGDSGALRRMDALRFVARIAAHDLDYADPIPLHPKRLSDARGKDLVRKMEEFSENDDSIRFIHQTVMQLTSDDFLGYAWWFIDPYLIDDVLAWAVKSPELPTYDHLLIASGYLFWGTALRLRPTLRNPYARASFKECIKGSDKFPFKEAIEEGIDWKSARAALLPRPFDTNEPSEKKRNVVHRNGCLFLSIAQRIPIIPPDGRRVDWDHFFAKALRNQLKLDVGEDRKKCGKKRVFHPSAGSIWRAGNLCALDSKLNRQLQDERPRKKLIRIAEWRESEELWPRDLFMSGEEEKGFLAIEDLLDRYDGKAPESLKEIVESREDRLWSEVACRYREVYEYFESVFSRSEVL